MHPAGWNVTPLQHLGARIRRRRHKLGLTLADVARMTGFRRQTIAELEHGNGVRIFALLCVLQVLGLKLKLVKSPDDERLAS